MDFIGCSQNDSGMNECIIAIVGTTGVRKSDLAIHLAKVLGGEVINGDSVQASV
jgi:tRNA A37 N6-isopentenylltransferase MiaA